MIQEEFRRLRFGQHNFGKSHVWAGIVLKSGSSQRNYAPGAVEGCPVWES